jgi:acyl transferase domain-containing protein
VLGHSLGEITAACVAGVLDLPAAAALVTARGRAMQGCPEGAMLALGCPAAEGLALVATAGMPLDLAASNSPEGCVLAGTPEVVEQFASWLGGRLWTRRLRSDRAFHSTLIEPATPRLAAALRQLRQDRSTLPWASGVTGRILAPGTEIAPDYFLGQARRPVQFAEALAAAAERLPGLVAVEAGPGRVLSALAEAQGVAAVPMSAQAEDVRGESVLAALGTLWTLGHDGIRAVPAGRGRPIRLPGYPFAGPAWIAPEIAAAGTRRSADTAPNGGPAQAAEDAEAAHAAPAAPGEPASVLTGLWSQVLGHAELTGDSDFFALGGDSLAITTVAHGLRRSLGVAVPLRDLMACRTLAGQTAAIHDALALAGRAG